MGGAIVKIEGSNCEVNILKKKTAYKFLLGKVSFFHLEMYIYKVTFTSMESEI